MDCVILRGRIVDVPDMKVSSNGACVATCTLASTDYSFKNKDGGYQTNFIPLVGFGPIGSLMHNYLTTVGQEILCTGKLVSGSYTRDDGTRKYYLEVSVDSIEFLGRRNDKEEKTSASKKK